MRRTIIPDQLVTTYMPPIQIDEPYVIYDIIWLPAVDGEPKRIGQMVSLSSLVDGRNTSHYVCGAITMTLNDFQFLHPETIQELCRGNMELVKKEVEKLNEAEQLVSKLSGQLGIAPQTQTLLGE